MKKFLKGNRMSYGFMAAQLEAVKDGSQEVKDCTVHAQMNSCMQSSQIEMCCGHTTEIMVNIKD